MKLAFCLGLLGFGGALALAACASSPGTTSDAGGHDASMPPGPDAGPDMGVSLPPEDGGQDAGPSPDAAPPPPVDTLGANRDRLLGTYLDFLKASAAPPQSNGLSGSDVATVCDLWAKLDPSSRDVFLTLTARMQGSTLGLDGSSMLSHITRLYRAVGGQGATASDAGSCGGGEYNRMIMSMDATLHTAQIAASTHKGALQGNGKYDVADAPKGTFWRDSHDLGGAHAPFDTSDETDQGAPRGQTQYFKDPASTLAKMPLGRQDLTLLVDPYAIEMDQDYDCVHNSNPDCSYVTYGPYCLPKSSALGVDIYAQTYGSFDPGWAPSGCP